MCHLRLMRERSGTDLEHPVVTARGEAAADVTRMDGLWRGTSAFEYLAGHLDGFYPACGEVAVPTQLTALRLDVFGPEALGVLSADLRFEDGRVEELRIEPCRYRHGQTTGQAMIDGTAVTCHPRIVYVVRLSLALDAEVPTGRLLLQRLTVPPARFGHAMTDADHAVLRAGPTLAVDCRLERPGVFRELEIACAVDRDAPDATTRRSAWRAFGIAPPGRAGGAGTSAARGGDAPIAAALARAGIAVRVRRIEVERGRESGARLARAAQVVAAASDDPDAGAALTAWSEDDLDAALEDQVAAQAGEDGEAPWRATVVLAPRFAERPSVVGTMFGTRRHPRRGCALFYDPAGDRDWTHGNAERALTFAGVHELGHLLNLLHCFQADETCHRRQPRRVDALTWMNYPNRYPFGVGLPPADAVRCRDAFWQRFEGRFATDELVHLRHGWSRDVRPAGALEPLMQAGPEPTAAGFDEAAAGFVGEPLLTDDPTLLAALFTAADEPVEPASRPQLRVHLPAEVVRGELILGWVELVNDTDNAWLIDADWGFASGRLDVRVEGPDDLVFAVEPHRRDCAGATRWLRPGERVSDRLALSFGATAYFTVAGRYRLRVGYGDDLAAIHDLEVHDTRPGENVWLNRLRDADGWGRALTLAGRDVVGATNLASLAHHLGPSRPTLRAATVRLAQLSEARRTTDAAAFTRTCEALVAGLEADAQAADAELRWLERTRWLHRLALVALRRDDLPAAVTARVAGAAARASLADLADRPVEPATTGAARAIAACADAVASG